MQRHPFELVVVTTGLAAWCLPVAAQVCWLIVVLFASPAYVRALRRCQSSAAE